MSVERVDPEATREPGRVERVVYLLLVGVHHVVLAAAIVVPITLLTHNVVADPYLHGAIDAGVVATAIPLYMFRYAERVEPYLKLAARSLAGGRR